MRTRLLLLLVAALGLTGLAGCSDDGSGEPQVAAESTTSTTTTTTTTTTTPSDDEPGTAFTWTTTWDLDGHGYVLTVEGTAGADHAGYTMQVEPLSADGASADLVTSMAGAAVNGLVEPGAELGDIDPDGATAVVVDGVDRWYRNPWLIDEAAFAMAGAEWVHVTGGRTFVADIASYALNERYDDALRALLQRIEAGDRIQAPRAGEDVGELDELLDPWIGLTGPSSPDGGPAVFTGDHREGTVSWDQTLTYEPDGADGRLAGHVTWERAPAPSPDHPDPDGVVELADLADRLSQAG